ncbi:hypothetical protein EON65_02940 [archaeon]|nr:MAG: hypothetical protein EON65_02940 [archaeon]
MLAKLESDQIFLWRSECLSKKAFSITAPDSNDAMPAYLPEATIYLNISKWWNWLSESELLRLKAMNCPISLSIEGFEKIPQQTFDMVGKYLSHDIVELTIVSCPDFTWTGEIKALLRSCAKLLSLRLVAVPWIDDGMIEQLSVRYHKSLKSIHLENCTLTNNSIFQIGRRCNQLQNFTLVCCTRISDTGLLELTKNTRLSYIHIAHNYNVTDKSLVALLGAAKNLCYLNLANCVKLTDQSISALYETTAAWGKKRNLAGSVLRHVNLQSNPNFTAQVLLWLSTSATVMQSIDISDCSALDITKGMNELFNLTDLRTLTLGPTSIPVNGAHFCEYLQCHADNLVSLHLNGLAGVDDEAMGQILDFLLNLQDLVLQDIPFGTAMTESLCSSIPNISKLHLIGSDYFGDSELRCIASVCLHIKDLAVSRCNRLTDAGFVRLIGLKFINHLSLAYCSRNCSGNIVKLLGVCPLRSLSLDGHRVSVQDALSYLRKETKIQLTKLSLQQAIGLTVSDVRFILENFVGLQSLDLTNASHLSPDQLMVLSHCNPFLSYSFSSDYSGFVLSSVNSRRYDQYWTMYDQLRRHYGARLLQRLRKRYLKRLDQLKELRKDKWSAFKISRIVLIQAIYRSHKARKETRKKLLAGRRLVRACKDWLFYLAYLKEVRAKSHYKRHLKSSLYGLLLKHHAQLQKRSRHANKVLVEHYNARMLKKYFKLLLSLRLVMQEIKFEYSALAFWEMNFMAKVIRRWKSVIFSSSKRNQKLSNQFLLCLPLATWNSSRQMHMLQLAGNFRKQKLLCIAWVVLAKDRLEKKRVDSLMPMAIEHFNKSFYNRLCGRINKEWSRYAKNRMYKRDKKQFGNFMYKMIRYRRGGVALDMNFFRIIFLKQCYHRAPPHFNTFTSRLMLTTRFVPLVKKAVVFRKLAKRADEYIKQRRLCKGYLTFMKGAIRMRMWRVMNKKAETASKTHYYRLTYNAWKEFRIYCHNLEELYVKRYLAKLKKKMFRLFQMAVKISKEVAKQLALEIEQKAQSEEAFRRAIYSLRVFQAKVRGYVVRKHFLEERVQKLYAIQVLQNFFRTYLARKEYASKLKKKDLEEKIREDKEQDMMQQEELDMLYFLYHVKAATDIQRAFRGMMGRRVAYNLAVDYYRKKLLDFQKGNQHTRLHHQAYLRAAYLREQQRHVAATDIERIARGKLCRLRFVIIKRHALMEKKAVIVQRWYRCHLAHVRLLAMRRDRYNEIRFREARKKRGLIFRMMGAKKRSKQKPLGKGLQELGLDPISYNHRLDELWEETKKDWHDFIAVLKRERALFKEHGLNKLNRMLGRRKLLADNGWKLKTQQAVKIVEPGHPYEGYTGVIVRIDDTVQGNPLYEVSLDKVNKQTFVRMTTDPLKIYETMQPLAAIENYPSLPMLTAATEIFGMRDDDPYYCKKNIYAAWTIQRAYRMHRARQIVGQKRFEHWKQCITRQHSLILHLSDSNALNTQGFNFAKLLNIRSFRPIKFDEIRHKLKPGRLSNVIAKASERSVISKEIDLKLKDRLKFLQKSALKQSKDFFATGYEQISSRKKLGMFLSSVYGLFYKKKDYSISGVQGVKYISGKQTLISGTDRYTFKQFHASPHVRYYKTSLYQGEWSGIPFVTNLRPHGEGLIMFLDGWGYAKEDKVLYLTIIACRHLNAADIATGSADPYCEIKCNGMQLQTSIKWTNLNPKWHENFEIDVTNPAAKLNIIVKDKDYFGSDDFMGQVELKLSDFSDGKTYHATYQLKGEVLTLQDDDEDRGEIELRYILSSITNLYSVLCLLYQWKLYLVCSS